MSDSVPKKTKLGKVNVYRFLVFTLNHSVLYDESEEDYDPDDQQAWDDIRHKMNKYCTIDESLLENGKLAEKFKNFKTKYRAEKKKTKPTLHYFSLMDAFLGEDQSSTKAKDLKAKRGKATEDGATLVTNSANTNNTRNTENLEKMVSTALNEISRIKEQLNNQNNSTGNKRRMEMSNSEMPSAKKAREPTCEAPNKVGPIRFLGESSKSSSGNQRDEATRPKVVADKVKPTCPPAKRNPAFWFLADVKGKTAEQLEKIIQQNKQFVGGTCTVEHIEQPNEHNISKVCIQIDPEFYRQIEKESFRLDIGLHTYRLRECTLLVQCFKCWVFGHKSNTCSSPFRCPRCGDIGCPKDCRKMISCLNCADVNHRLQRKVFSTGHFADDPNCLCRVQLEKIERAKVNYPEP